MLKKIIKHEIRLSIREISLICIALLAVGVLSPLIWKLNSYLMSFFATSLLIVIYGSTFIVTLLVLYRIFYKSMFENEGYLTNVIPVKASTLVIGKYLSALLLLAMVYLSLIFSIILCIVISGGLQALIQFINFFELNFLFHYETFLTVTNVCILIMIAVFSSAALFFFVSALVNIFNITKYKKLAVIGLYIACSQAINVVSMIPFRIITLIGDNYSNPLLSMNLSVGAMSLVYTAITVGLMALTIWIVDKKVNIK